MSREWIYAQAPARASKMANRCAIMAATQIHVHEEAVLQKKVVLSMRLQRWGDL